MKVRPLNNNLFILSSNLLHYTTQYTRSYFLQVALTPSPCPTSASLSTSSVTHVWLRDSTVCISSTQSLHASPSTAPPGWQSRRIPHAPGAALRVCFPPGCRLSPAAPLRCLTVVPRCSSDRYCLTALAATCSAYIGAGAVRVSSSLGLPARWPAFARAGSVARERVPWRAA